MFVYHMDPLQPYFVLNTGVYHKFIPVNSPVAHFYQFTYTEKNPVVSGVVPDGAVDLILDTGSGLATISGPVESVERSPFLEGHTYFGVRFKPGVSAYYGDILTSDLVGTSVPAFDLIRRRSFDILADTPDFAQRIESMQDILQDLLFSRDRHIPVLVKGMLECIFKCHGEVSVHELENRFFYSRRHLLRVFRQYMGMDIKTYCRIVRFQSVLSELNGGFPSQFTEVAQEHGYYDQTHFQKEFKKFALLTPGEYVKILRENKYQSRIHTC